jgi:hypothetical protein
MTRNAAFNLVAIDSHAVLARVIARQDAPIALEAGRTWGFTDPDVVGRAGPVVLMEPVPDGNGSALLVIAQDPGAAEMYTNGCPSLVMEVLRDRDVLRIGDRPAVQVTLSAEVRTGTPSVELISQPCPICLVPFTSRTTVAVCGQCGAAMHLEGDDVPESDRLRCAALVRECPICKGPTTGFDPEESADGKTT